MRRECTCNWHRMNYRMNHRMTRYDESHVLQKRFAFLVHLVGVVCVYHELQLVPGLQC